MSLRQLGDKNVDQVQFTCLYRGAQLTLKAVFKIYNLPHIHGPLQNQTISVVCSK